VVEPIGLDHLFAALTRLETGCQARRRFGMPHFG
jgi:hypothetical protein